ncbi:MAG: hypothetical protein HY538_01840 [Deltaproteobacteria bacterium]|nr:hypothetical protein [Deltaproteobacteria bacterium]
MIWILLSALLLYLVIQIYGVDQRLATLVEEAQEVILRLLRRRWQHVAEFLKKEPALTSSFSFPPRLPSTESPYPEGLTWDEELRLADQLAHSLRSTPGPLLKELQEIESQLQMAVQYHRSASRSWNEFRKPVWRGWVRLFSRRGFAAEPILPSITVVVQKIR